MSARFVFEIVLGALIIILILICAILGAAVKDLWNQTQTGRINYKSLGKEKKVERQIKEKFNK